MSKITSLTTMSFVARRGISLCGVRLYVNPYVNVTATGGSGYFSLCLNQFRRAFGFTPRKGVTYRLTASDVQIKELKS